MLKNYFRIAIRILARQRGFTFINVGGLTIGITSSLLLILFVQDELSFDRFHPDAERIYRVGFQGQLQGNPFHSAETGIPLAQALKQETPEIESTLRVASWHTFPVQYQDKKYTEPYLLLTDPNFFTFFNFKIIEGDVRNVLTRKDQLVISTSAAKKYFNYACKENESPIGKTMILAQGYEATVAAIAEDAPANSHLHYSLILSISSWEGIENSGWMNGLVKTYFKLKPEASLPAVEQKLDQFTKTYLKKELESYQANLDQLQNQGNYLGFFVQKLTDIHLHSQLDNEIEANGKAQYIYLFGAIAAFITLLVCINFVNLSTARSASRAKEVGVRKVNGAINRTLVVQFLFESYCYTIIALLFALIFVVLSLVPFNVITGKELSIGALYHPFFISGIILFLLLVGLLSGVYPALILSYLSPAQILKGQVRSGITTYGIRNLLVTFQFVISISLIISTWVVYEQVRFMESHPVGFDKANLVNLLHTANLGANSDAFKQDLQAVPGIISASYANRLPPNINQLGIFRLEGIDKDFLMYTYEMDPDHLETMGYQMVSGRFFSNHPSDSSAIIINESAAAKLNLNHQVNKKHLTSYSPNKFTREVIGVMQDFHFHALKDSVRPLAIVLGRQPNWEMAIRIESENQEKTIKEIESLWQKYAPDAPFEYSFLANNYKDNYKNEHQVTNVFLVFALLAILIASLGLLGLATYSAEQRSKEIGIRKVLGASIFNVSLLLTKDFTRFIIIAFIVSAPITWWGLREWLQQYPYRISFPWHIIMMSGLLSVLIAIATVSFRAIKAAIQNPTRSLRNE